MSRITFPLDVIIVVDNINYKQEKTEDLQPNDLVLDEKDGLYAYIESINGDTVDLKITKTVAINVPKKQLRKLCQQ
jgi:preprotein translocase subunit YajC